MVTPAVMPFTSEADNAKVPGPALAMVPIAHVPTTGILNETRDQQISPAWDSAESIREAQVCAAFVYICAD